ncbi:MAG TPA: DNA-formamidopyrimidine glycosylase family protein [Acidimicrobiales bacterium]|nr:DNA-formamidopyrimidine glycosylase family protein [Acidimicrobiales bacterium]
MPEGDTLARTAATMHRWLAGREITAATTKVEGFPAERLVGRRILAVDAWGKNLMVRLDGDEVLHTHLRMTGSWHVYPAGHPWRRPERQARLALTCGDRLAVCFNAPVVELVPAGSMARHPALGNLGPDVLGQPLVLAEVRRRAQAGPPDRPVGELLLDQRVVAGIGNIWRCEALFAEGHNPWTPVSALTDAQLDALVSTAGRLMRASVESRTGAPEGRSVYRRAGRPCPRCRTPVKSRRQGDQARTAYWCPTCQPHPVTAPASTGPPEPPAPLVPPTGPAAS